MITDMFTDCNKSFRSCRVVSRINFTDSTRRTFRVSVSAYLKSPKKAQIPPVPLYNPLFSFYSLCYSQYRLAMPLNIYCSRKAALSQKQSIISVIMLVFSVASIARRRILYAYFLISARLFRDFFAGERSSLNVSSST